MASTTVYDDTYGKHTYSYSSTYSTARDATTGSLGSHNAIRMGQSGVSTAYIYRGHLVFDTSGIPEGSTINSVTLRLYLYDYSTNEFTLKIFDGSPGSISVAAADHDRTLYTYTTTLGSLASTSFDDGNYNDITLSTSSVNAGGYTELLAVSGEDCDGSGSPPNGNEYCETWDDSALTVNYDAPAGWAGGTLNSTTAANIDSINTVDIVDIDTWNGI